MLTFINYCSWVLTSDIWHWCYHYQSGLKALALVSLHLTYLEFKLSKTSHTPIFTHSSGLSKAFFRCQKLVMLSWSRILWNMHTFENWLWYNLPTLWVENENLKWISFSFFKWHKTEEDNNEKFKMNFSTQVSDLCRHSPRCCFNGKKFVERQRNARQLNCAEPYYKILGCIFWTSWKDLPRYIV